MQLLGQKVVDWVVGRACTGAFVSCWALNGEPRGRVLLKDIGSVAPDNETDWSHCHLLLTAAVCGIKLEEGGDSGLVKHSRGCRW